MAVQAAIPALGKLRQEDHREFKAKLADRGDPVFKR